MAEFDYLRKRFRNVGLSPRDAKRLYAYFKLQLQSAGRNGAIIRFKRIGDAIVHYFAGTKPDQPIWVKTLHRFPRCIYFIRKYDPRIVLSVAKIARSITLSKPTKAQIEKVVQGATAPCAGGDYLELVRHLLLNGLRVYGIKPTVTQPSMPDLIFRQYQFDGDSYLPDIDTAVRFVSDCELAQQLPYMSETFYPIKLGCLPQTGPWSGYVGSINATQEGGGKLRMFAAPLKIIQALLSPIHVWIDKHRRHCDTDCTYDQFAGAKFAQDKMNSGVTVHSVDLSTATCRFPLDIQLWLVKILGLDKVFVDFLEFACKGIWKVSDELVSYGFPSVLRWEVGQPLGIKPSMSMFSFTHNCLLAGLCYELNITPSDSFRVLGDDVVISNDALHLRYREVISLMGVPISENKSHSSSKYAEFAGYSITPTHLVRGGKWPRAEYKNHLSIAETWETHLTGESSRDMLKAQSFWLFRNEKYFPSDIEEFSRLLKANSLFNERQFDTRDLISHKVRFEVGCVKYVRETFAVVPITYTDKRYEPSYQSVLDCIPDPIWRRTAYAQWQWWLDIVDYNTVMYYLYDTVLRNLANMFVCGEISPDDLLPLIKKVEARVLEHFWIPPVKSELNAASLHRRIMQTYLRTIRFEGVGRPTVADATMIPVQ